MNNLCTNGGLDAVDKYLTNNTLYYESWEKCFSKGLGLEGSLCPFEDINEEKFCSKGSAEDYITFLKKIMTECPDHSLAIDEEYYIVSFNKINVCSKDSDSGKKCRDIAKYYKNKPLKKLTYLQPIYWESNLCKSSCGTEYDVLYKEIGNSKTCATYEDSAICKEFQAGKSACEANSNGFDIGRVIIWGIAGGVIAAIISVIFSFSNKKKNKDKDNNKNKNKNNNDDNNIV